MRELDPLDMTVKELIEEIRSFRQQHRATVENSGCVITFTITNIDFALVEVLVEGVKEVGKYRLKEGDSFVISYPRP